MNPLSRLCAAAGCRVSALLAASALLSLSTSTFADNLHRLYDFEEGTPGAVATEVVDTLGDPPHLQEAFQDFYTFDHLVPGSNNAIPTGEPIQTWITNNVDPTPSLYEPFPTVAPTFFDVSDGSAFDSPSTGSTVALDFNGQQALQGVGFRDSYAEQTAYNNDAAADNTNVLSTFATLSEAWVYPDSASQGVTQTVWAIGEENGGVQITANGLWDLTATGSTNAGGVLVSVAFDAWTHLGVVRTGGSATLYVNGSPTATAAGFFGKWGDHVTLGADEDFVQPFDGKIDSFGVGGQFVGDFDPVRDLSYFTDVPEPAALALVVAAASTAALRRR